MANTKISDLSADTAPTSDDITVIVDIGTGANKKATLANLGKGITAAAGFTVANEATDTTCFPVFVTAATGDLAPKSNAGLTFNSSTGVLSSTFSGNITGNVTGNCSGTAATVTTAAQPSITSLGTLTTLTVDDITINGNAVSSAGASSLTIAPAAGQKLVLDGHWGFDGVNFTAETDANTVFTAYTGKNITIESVTFDGGVVAGVAGLTSTTLTVTATDSIKLGTGSSATGQITLYNSTNNNTVIIQPGASAASVTYTWPTNVGAAGSVLTDAAGNGVLSWAASGGGCTLDSAYDFGGAGAGRTITADTGAVAISATAEALDIDSTATTQTILDVTGSSLTSGSLAKFYSASANTGTNRNLVSIEDASTGQTHTRLLSLTSASTDNTGSYGLLMTLASAQGIYLTQSATAGAKALIIDSEATTADAVVDINTAATTGTGLKVVGDALTTGQNTRLASSSNAMSSGSMLVSSSSPGGITANKTGSMNLFEASRTMTAATTRSDDYDLLSLQRTSIANGASSTFNTTGSVLYVSNTFTNTSSAAYSDTTKGIELVMGALGTGDGIYIDHNNTAGACSIMIDSEAATATTGVVNMDLAITTGIGIDISEATLTTGSHISCISNSADTTARNIVYVKNDNAAAVGASPITVVNDAVISEHFYIGITLGTTKLYYSDGTTPNGALSGAAGDVCFNADSGKSYYCTGTTNWTAFA